MSRSSEPTSALARSRLAGDRAEDNVLRLVEGLRYVTDTEAEHYDAVTETLIVPSDRLPFVGIAVLEVGVAVEIKSAGVVYGESQRRGRFYLRRSQHDRLVEAGGVYLFAVCGPNNREVVAMKIVPATQVEQLIDAVTDHWRTAGDSRDECVQLSWARIFDPEAIEGGGKR